MPTPAADSSEIGDYLKQIREREGRSGSVPTDDSMMSYTLDFIPATEAPVGEKGILRFRSDCRAGKICHAECATKNGCSCFNQRPMHWAPMPTGWKAGMGG